MRYFLFSLNATAEWIKSKAKINLRDYGWDNPITSMNTYMLRNMRNDINYFAYREEDGAICANFSYDEQKMEYADAYDHIMGHMQEAFRIISTVSDPEEITMYQYMECLIEAKRRDYINSHGRITEGSKLWIYYDQTDDLRYDFSERIIPENPGQAEAIYDQGFIDEIDNIESSDTPDGFTGNMVHYVISARSIEAAGEMTGRLMQSLYASGRIGSRRMEIISDIDPNVYRFRNHIEEIIENNYGGVVVISLREKFGYDPVDYVVTSDYLEKLVRKYRNRCLFVFTYDMDHPGFSYQLLPKLSKHVIPVMLKEGRGDRRDALKYMRSLIASSDHAEYAGLAGEYMKLYPGDDFTQTDVLNAYDRFESWCINRNYQGAYEFNHAGEFSLDRDVSDESSYDKLQNMIGLISVKRQIDSIIVSDIVEKERARRMCSTYQSGSMHMIFGGNPGTAKTTVAKLFAGIAREKGILRSGAFVERGGMDLDGFGCVRAIRAAFTAAKGGVLFIDEAYSMRSDTAVTVLIQEMENMRDDVIVILAGYNERMKDFMKINEGLKSRIPHWIDFPDYTADELTRIFSLMAAERGFTITDAALKEAHFIFDKIRNTENFGNGRYVRNLIDRAAQNQAMRLLADGRDVKSIRKGMLFKLTGDDISEPDDGLRAKRKTGTAGRELNEMVGLSSVKEVIHKATAHFKLSRMCMDRGLSGERASMHMVFTGNPGTAKTTVARLFAEIMKDEKVLPTGVFVEAGRADLIGDHVGSTAPLVRRRFREAQGGVLFIDEAYLLCDGQKGGFGDEAIGTIVQEMENHRDDVIVIFAGYPGPMKEFLDRNPGMKSRIAFQVEFADYDTDELCEITKLMADGRHMRITDEAMDKLRYIYEAARRVDDYGNGRFVRKMLEEARMNMAERLMDCSEGELTDEMITTIEECDIPSQLLLSEFTGRLAHIGFVS